MKRLKITREQADMLKKRVQKKKVRLTESQLNMVLSSLNPDIDRSEITRLVKEDFTQNSDNKEGSPVKTGDFYSGVLTMLKSMISKEVLEDIPKVFYDMRVTKEDVEETIQELGLLSDSFFRLDYREKVKALKNKLKYAYDVLSSKSETSKDKFAVGDKISEFAGLPETIGQDTEIKKITIDSLSDIGGVDVLVHKKDLIRYIKDYQKRFREKPIFRFNGKHITVTNIPFTLTKLKYGKRPKIKKEMTGTGSSGAFVGPLSLGDEIQSEMTGTGSSGAYDAPGFAKTKIGTKVGNVTQNFDIYSENAPNLASTGWPDGEFVSFDDCTKLNNNKVAQNGGCNQGDSGVVKTHKTAKSVISKKP